MQYIHYTGPSSSQSRAPYGATAGVTPQETTAATSTSRPAVAAAAAAAASGSSGPLVATGDWTKDLVHLAKTAELKKHALTLQLHTAHILSAHASLDQKGKAVEDVREQKNKLESERVRLLNCLREINEDRGKADLMEANLERECSEMRHKIAELTEGEYAIAKKEVDRLRQELGQPPLANLQSTIDEKKFSYLEERRLQGGKEKRGDDGEDGERSRSKKSRGRPRGSKNKKTVA